MLLPLNVRHFRLNTLVRDLFRSFSIHYWWPIFLLLFTNNFVRMWRITFSFYLGEQMTFVFKEKRVLENLPVRIFDLVFMKVIHVQLTNERWKITVFEILWQNILTKHVLMQNLKPIAGVSPGDDIVIFSTIYNLE